MIMNITDDSYLLKLKQMKWDDARIGARMGIPPEEVKRRWDNLVKVTNEPGFSGIQELRQVGMVMVTQYQLMGQTLGIFTAALNDTFEPSELRGIIESCPKDTDLATWLVRNALILKPFSLPSPQQLAQEIERAGKAPVN